jgi:CHAD domain-containing protein
MCSMHRYIYLREMSAQTKDTVAPVKVELKEFIASSKRNVSRVSKRLDNYLRDSNEKNIHDMRTSVRRMESSYRTLPRKMRKKNRIKRYVSRCKDLFRLNSEIRDYDIITQKIQQYEQGQNDGVENYKKRLASRREAKLQQARALALEVREMGVPNFTRSNLSNKKLTKRYNKIVSKFANKIMMNLPIVVTDANKLKELHEMRIDCKKLRYLLELLPIDSSSNKGNVSLLLQQLKKMQDILGEIHDCDAVISYLKRQAKSNQLHGITDKIIEERNKKYQEFRTYYKATDISNNQNHSLLLNICRIT